MTLSTKGKLRRERIVSTAIELFHRKGFGATSFTDIADASGLQRGNFYYYFRSKEEILSAVVGAKLEDLVQQFDELDKTEKEPVERLSRYLDSFKEECELRQLHGCAMGSLAQELAKDDRVHVQEPQKLMNLTLEWLEKQFKLAPNAPDPNALAVSTLCRMQGAALLGSVYEDATLLGEQFDETKRWIRSVFERG